MSNTPPTLIAIGWNNQAGFFAPNPQPHILGPLETVRDYAYGAAFVSQGMHVKLSYSALLEDVEAGLNAQFGLSQYVPYNEITISIPSFVDRRIAFINFNGTIAMPQHEVDDKHALGVFSNTVYIVGGLVSF